MHRVRPLTSTMEDYIEAIYRLSKEKRTIRVKDIALRMNVKMPSVTSMLNSLNKRGLVIYAKNDYVELTSDGDSLGASIAERHEALFQFLTNILRISPERADIEACKMEHALSDETLSSLIDFMEFIRICPRTGDDWMKHFEEYHEYGKTATDCALKAKEFACKFVE